MFHRLRVDRSLLFCYIVVMEFAIGIGIGVVIAALLGKKKRGKTTPYDPSKTNTPQETPEERKRRETDELITTVLPTINNGK